MMNQLSKSITLKHLLIDGKKQIGMQFYPDKIIHAIIKTLSDAKWSNAYGMVFVLNTKENLTEIFNKFRGVAWINCSYFFKDRPLRNDNEPLEVQWFRTRKTPAGRKQCPEEYFQKLEIKRYSMSTARTYISLFEHFLNYYKDYDPIELNENDVRNYLSHLVQQRRSNSHIDQCDQVLL